MRVCSIVGARPQFVKAATVSRKLRAVGEEVLVHTGQHYDEALSDVFFEELDIPEPEYDLGVAAEGHARQTGQMLLELEPVLEEVDPDALVLYGDTNSTLAGAIAGAKRDVYVAHVEAGLRSDNRGMPEEINRILTDHAADCWFAPSEQAVKRLAAEGITDEVYQTGDVMYDAVLEASARARRESTILESLGLDPGAFVLATVHRAGNTDDRSTLAAIIEGLATAPLPVVFPVHPRTERRLREFDLWERASQAFDLVEPVGYLDFLRLLETADRVATDSGGVQKEAFFLETPCLTLREETEWPETVTAGWNRLVGPRPERIQAALREEYQPAIDREPYGDGTASRQIVDHLWRTLATSDVATPLETASLD